ncbi:GH25 family lysozyme [Lactiplantibacillus carotarum]|uniref:GH25 family lysozyme n=1 Tax=Lactiplantibacillus carotarum TaxID=2993456 RepID=UPI00298F05E2|nr:GH25 family lysozyme [Lactiplantibacillus carotarum]
MGLKKGWGLALTTLGFCLTLGTATKAQAAVPDISEWQGRLTSTQVQSMKSQVKFVINRVQYGSGYEDRHHNDNENLYVKYGVPFGSYDFATFKTVAQARTEAKVFYNRANKHTRFYVLDFETTSMGSAAANAAVKAWYQEMRKLTKKHLIFYSYQSFATTYANASRGAFDAQWIANYSNKPTISFSLWQYSSTHYLSSLGLHVDNSLYGKASVTNYHPLKWWLGESTKKKTTVKKPAASTTSTQTATQKPATTTPATSTNTATTPTTTPATTTPAVKYAYSSYKKGQRAYLKKTATNYYGGEAIPAGNRQKPYTIKQTKKVTTGSSKEVVYLSGLNKWVLSQDVTGFWASGSQGKFTAKHNLNVYSDAKLSHKTGAKVLKGKTVTGKVVRDGNYYRIKLDKGGYVTAKVRNTSYKHVKYVYSSYKKGEYAYLYKASQKYTDGSWIPATAKQKFYKITKVKSKVTSRSRQVVYLGGLKKWVRTQDMTGYWKKGSKGTFKVRSKANVYGTSSLKAKKYALKKGAKVKGTVIKKGRLYRVKLDHKAGYVTAKVSVFNKVK